MIYVLVTNRYATLKEIRDDYSIEEVLDLYEMCLTQLANQQLVAESVQRKG